MTWTLAVDCLGRHNEDRGYRVDIANSDPSPRTTGEQGVSLLANRAYDMKLPELLEIDKKMINTIPVIMLV